MLPELRTDLSGPIFMENGATSTYFMPNLAKDMYFYAKRDRWGGGTGLRSADGLSMASIWGMPWLGSAGWSDLAQLGSAWLGLLTAAATPATTPGKQNQ